MKKLIGTILFLFVITVSLNAFWNGRIGGEQYIVFDYDDSLGVNDTLISSSYNCRWWSTLAIWWKAMAVENYLLMDGDTVVAPVYPNELTGKTSNATGLVLTAALWGDTAGVVSLYDVSGIFQNNESLFVSTTYIGIMNGTIGDVYLTYDNEDVGETFIVGTDSIIGVINASKGLLKGMQDDGNAGKLVILATNATAYADTDTIFGHSSLDTADVLTEERLTDPTITIYPLLSPISESLFCYPDDADSVVVDDMNAHIKGINFPRMDNLKFRLINTSATTAARLKMFATFTY